MIRSRKLLLVLAALVGAAIVSAAYGAETVAAGLSAVTLDTRIDLGTVLTLVVIAGGGTGVWVKMNRESARAQAQIESLREGQARTEAAVTVVHARLDGFLLQGRGSGQ